MILCHIDTMTDMQVGGTGIETEAIETRTRTRATKTKTEEMTTNAEMQALPDAHTATDLVATISIPSSGII